MTRKLAIGVMVSGNGSNLQSLIDGQISARLPIEIRLVWSNTADALALERAKLAQIPTRKLSHKNFASREAYDQQISQAMREHGVELIVMAGFMRLVSAEFVQQWQDRLINIHPSLLPAFPGLHAQRQALEYGVKVAGCSVFFVEQGCDSGPIIIQASVPVLTEDTEESLSQRILSKEHLILPQAVKWIAEGKVSRHGRHVMTPPFDFHREEVL